MRRQLSIIQITPELEQKLKKRNSDLEDKLSPLAPREVVNPLADTFEQPRGSLTNSLTGPMSNRVCINLHRVYAKSRANLSSEDNSYMVSGLSDPHKSSISIFEFRG